MVLGIEGFGIVEILDALLGKFSFTFSIFNFYKYRIFCGIFEVFFEKLNSI
jgi:hypothetical protein